MPARTIPLRAPAASRAPTMHFGVTHRKALEALALYPAGFTAEQPARLLGSPSSLTYFRAIGKDLVEAGYVQKAPLARVNQHGRVPSVFLLARKGWKLLESEGIHVEARYAPSEALALSFIFRAHA